MSANTITLEDVTLKLTKSTKGTHVFGNEELGLSFYFPKELFTNPKGDAPLQIILHVGTPAE